MMIGGRSSPAQPLNDVWLLHLPTATWRPVHITNTIPAPTTADQDTASQPTITPTVSPPWPGRYRHSAVSVTTTPTDGSTTSPSAGHTLDGRHTQQLPATCVYVFGGRSDTTVYSDLWVLVPPHDLTTNALSNSQSNGHNGQGQGVGMASVLEGWSWVQIPQQSEPAGIDGGDVPLYAWPSARKSHAAAAGPDGCVYVHGGAATYGGHERDVYRLDVAAVRRYVRSVLPQNTAAVQAPTAAKQIVPQSNGVRSTYWKLMAPSKPKVVSGNNGDNNRHAQGEKGHAGKGDSGGDAVQGPAAMSHVLVPLPHTPYLLCVGGHPTHTHQWIHAFDTVSTIHAHAYDLTVLYKHAQG